MEPAQSRSKPVAGNHAQVTKLTPLLRKRVAQGSALVRLSPRQADRTAATRLKLLESAERIFTRDGFEAARLSDIAGDAGYTRGAFYAHFDSKEAIFFAILQTWVGNQIDAVKSLLQRHDTPAAKLAALRKHYAENAKNRKLVLMSLEFKLFALRHPRAHARLRAQMRRIRATSGEIIDSLLKEAGLTISLPSRSAATCLNALSQGLLLEHLVDHKSLPDKELRVVLGLFFDALLLPAGK